MSDNGENKQTAADLDELFGAPPADPGDAGPTKILETVLLRFLARVIHADGVIHDKEKQMLLDVAENFELPAAEAQRILDDEVERKSDPEALARQIPDAQRRRESYVMGCLMSFADGDSDDAEKAVLDAFARGAEITEGDAHKILEEIARVAEATRAQQQPS